MTDKQFKEWRLREGLTVEQTAALMGVSVRSVNNYQSGAQPVPRLVWLATLAISAGLVDKK